MFTAEPRVMDQIAAHAVEDYPREACGLVAVVNGRNRYLRCRNAATGDDHFVIPPADYARVEDMGEVVAVAHSHPDAPATPSEHDRVMCERTGVPWLIVTARKMDDGSLSTHEWGQCEPSGYQPALIGRPFSHGVLDCYSLLRDWYARERAITLPDFDRRSEWWQHGQNLYLDHFGDAGFRALPDGTEPQVGDVFLMQVRSPVPNHAAVYVGDSLILHHLDGRLSSRDVYGGHWRDVTVRHLRHRLLDPQ